MTALEIGKLLTGIRFTIGAEKQLQKEMENVFISNNIPYKREVILDFQNTIDFVVDGIGIEIKVKGNRRSILRQCERYSTFECLNEIILVTAVMMGLPKELNGKPAYLFNLGTAWL